MAEQLSTGEYLNTLASMQKDVYKTAVEHGWWEEKRSFGDILALCHSELSEALEEFRAGKPMFYYEDETPSDVVHVGRKPEGIAIEMADCIIRILDWAEHEGVSMQHMVAIKMAYNDTREYRHGGKAL